MAVKENLNPLKMLLFSMGLMLIGGTVLLAVLIWEKAGEPAEAHTSTHEAADCAGGHVDLKGRGVIVDSTMEGQIMRVTLEKHEGKMETLMIDMCSGKIVGSLTIDSDAAVVEE